MIVIILTMLVFTTPFTIYMFMGINICGHHMTAKINTKLKIMHPQCIQCFVNTWASQNRWNTHKKDRSHLIHILYVLE